MSHPSASKRLCGLRASWPTLAAASIVAIAVAGCAPNVTHRGHFLSDSDLSQVSPGMGQDQVRLALGTPTTQSALGGGAYYYMSSREEQRAFFEPEVTDRRVVAVYFDQFGLVDRVANYGLKDGKLFDFVSRKTATATGEESFLQQWFKGLGRRQFIQDNALSVENLDI